MLHQIKEQYNGTENTTHDLTLAWDTMQTKVTKMTSDIKKFSD